ncbi:MAG: hypothetical protein RR448_02465 [Niameybacter sp.]|uniref:hypothetical protein n=1 Tax=Niameybacter sp. TaxID=2033640 RepID=UPI002FCC4249
MKNYIKLICFSFICLLLIKPINAATSYTLEVNEVPYQTKAPLIERNDTLYISLSELADIFYADLTIEGESYFLNFQSKTFKLQPELRTFSSGSEKLILSEPCFKLEDTLYVPIHFLQLILEDGTVTLEDHTLQITTPVAYSRNSDSPTDHTYLESTYNLKNLPKHIVSLSTGTPTEIILESAISNKQYVSFLDNTNQTKVLDYLRSRLGHSPYNNIQVTYRILNTHTYPNQIVDTVTLPLKIDFYGSTLQLHLGSDKWTYPTIWSTFYPTYSLTEMDLHKSVDATLMRALYEYYRNKHDLKDDKYFSPFTLISSERTNEMLHQTYSLSYADNDLLTEHETTYTIRVQRVHQSRKLHYIIDIAAN